MDSENARATVEGFLRTAFEQGKPHEAASRFMAETYIQHSPTATNGREGFLAFATALAEEKGGLELNFRRMLVDGDLVAVHMWVKGFGNDVGGPGHAVVDIFRLDSDGRIAEHWDVMQPIPADEADPARRF
jgi:predicted SnoaL-like aldol condensation-catalyzing enzyme